MSLREQKKRETASAIRRVALEMFVEHGYEHVTVGEIAAAAKVSKMTVFNYFPTKEDIVMAPLEDHVEEFSEAVRARPEGETALAAIRRHWLDRLAARDPVSGLNDSPHVLVMMRLMLRTPALLLKLREYSFRTEAAVVAVLAKETDQLTAELVAAELGAVRAVLMNRNLEALLAGRSADELYPEAVAAVNRALDLMEHGVTL
jgi:AcrR family transcriptional regulator